MLKNMNICFLNNRNWPTIMELCQVVPSANLTTLWHIVVPCRAHWHGTRHFKCQQRYIYTSPTKSVLRECPRVKQESQCHMNAFLYPSHHLEYCTLQNALNCTLCEPRPSHRANCLFTVSPRNMAGAEGRVDTLVSWVLDICLLLDVSLRASLSQAGGENLNHALTSISPLTLPSCFYILS